MIGAAGVVAGLESYGIKDAISVTGKIKPGLPSFELPKFQIETGNVTMSTSDIFTVSIWTNEIRWIIDDHSLDAICQYTVLY